MWSTTTEAARSIKPVIDFLNILTSGSKSSRWQKTFLPQRTAEEESLCDQEEIFRLINMMYILPINEKMNFFFKEYM